MIIMPEQIVDGKRRCAVRHLCCQRMSWDFTITNQDDFEDFIRQIASAWERAEQDKMSLDIRIHQVDTP